MIFKLFVDFYFNRLIEISLLYHLIISFTMFEIIVFEIC